MRFASLEIHKEEFSFSAGHFTIFSATEREHLHGHNYYVGVEFDIQIDSKGNGLSFDYRHYKKKILALCDQLDRRFILANSSPYLKIEDEGEYWIAHFNHKKLPFLKEDTVLLPLTNITIEELAHWFLQNLITDQPELAQHLIHGIHVKVYNGPGQSGGARWSRD